MTTKKKLEERKKEVLVTRLVNSYLLLLTYYVPGNVRAAGGSGMSMVCLGDVGKFPRTL